MVELDGIGLEAVAEPAGDTPRQAAVRAAVTVVVLTSPTQRPPLRDVAEERVEVLGQRQAARYWQTVYSGEVVRSTTAAANCPGDASATACSAR